MNEIEKKYHDITNSGDIYLSGDPELLAYQYSIVSRLDDYNKTPSTREGMDERQQILKEICGTYNEDLYILPPIYATFGLRHVHFGKDVFVNFCCKFLDDADIFIGDSCMIGPGVTIVTASHPISPKLRLPKLEYNKPVYIGKNVWIGANVTILPGVKVGDNAVIGAGSVVTHDVGSNTIVAGSPAKFLRVITEEDDRFYDHNKPIPQELIDEYL